MTNIIIFVILGFVIFIETIILIFDKFQCLKKFYNSLNLLGMIVFLPIYVVISITLGFIMLILSPFCYKKERDEK